MQKTQLDSKYHVVLADPNKDAQSEICIKEDFDTIVELLGFLHSIAGRSQVLDATLFNCLMMMRDGQFETDILITDQSVITGIKRRIRITPSKRFHELFWKGFSASRK
jgi:hypothetical protein